MESWMVEFFKLMAPTIGWILLAVLLVLLVLNRRHIQSWMLVLKRRYIQLWMPEWLKKAAARIGWILLGALLVLFVFWCRREYGKEVAFEMYVRALREKPPDMEAVGRLFAGSKRTITASSKDFSAFRFRFSGGGEIDVAFDGNRRVLDINPTFASDAIGWLTWLLHRRELFSVSVTIPETKR